MNVGLRGAGEHFRGFGERLGGGGGGMAVGLEYFGEKDDFLAIFRTWVAQIGER